MKSENLLLAFCGVFIVTICGLGVLGRADSAASAIAKAEPERDRIYHHHTAGELGLSQIPPTDDEEWREMLSVASTWTLPPEAPPLARFMSEHHSSFDWTRVAHWQEVTHPTSGQVAIILANIKGDRQLWAFQQGKGWSFSAQGSYDGVENAASLFDWWGVAETCR